MKIVVTGALGHIGSRLIRELPGHDLVLLDDLSTQRFSSLFNLPASTRFEFHEVDVRSAALEPFFEGADAVIHLAALTDAASSFGRAEQVEEVNFGATVRVAEACAVTGAPLVFLSTTSVYGTQNEVVDEDCSESELQPQSPYAVSNYVRNERSHNCPDCVSWRAGSGRFSVSRPACVFTPR